MADNLREALLVQYANVRFLIMSQRQTVEGRRRQHDLRNHPMLWWAHLAGQAEYKDIYEFAPRTLSASPSSSAAERSFSLQKKIRTEARNQLSSEKVRKLMFCHWNGRLALRNVPFISETAAFRMSASPGDETVSEVLSDADLGNNVISEDQE